MNRVKAIFSIEIDVMFFFIDTLQIHCRSLKKVVFSPVEYINKVSGADIAPRGYSSLQKGLNSNEVVGDLTTHLIGIKIFVVPNKKGEKSGLIIYLISIIFTDNSSLRFVELPPGFQVCFIICFQYVFFGVSECCVHTIQTRSMCQF
jgi:hypothetical protein